MHHSSLENGIASMEHVAQIEVPEGATFTFAPGGYHLMMMNRQNELTLGERIEVSLLFADGQSLPVTFTAVPTGAN